MSINFIKLGELQIIAPENIQTVESIFSDASIEERFKKFAGALKRIAPRADEFLYFSAVMMHAAEASTVNPDGTTKLTAKGEPLKVSWDRKGDSCRWVSNDPTVMPYRNSNLDIFPESELLKAYALFRGRPLCINHKSSSVDDIRGIILDTYYDRTFKRVIALCALDKLTYPDLANKVALGYSTCVSMGTGVGRACCTNCYKVARTESDFCQHMKTRSCYGEVNLDLQPIELSIVVSGADPQAKIRTIIAAANTINNHLASQENELSSSSNIEEDRISEIEQDIKAANEKLAELKAIIESEESPKEATPPYGQYSSTASEQEDETDPNAGTLSFPERFASNSGYNNALVNEMQVLRASLEQKLHVVEKSLEKLHFINKEENMSREINKEAYFQGGGGVNEPTPGQKKYPVDPTNEKMRMEDKHMVGESPFPEVGAVDGMHPSPSSVDQKDELERKKMLARAEQEERMMRRTDALKIAKEKLMEQKKQAYFQGGGGVNEPAPHKVKYPIDPLQDNLREKEDKQMVGQKPFPEVGAVDGLHPSPLSVDEKDELERKKMLQRASLKARFVKAANPDGTDNLGASGWQVYANNGESNKLVFSATVDEISGGRSDVLFDVIATKDFGSKMINKIRTVGLTKAASVYKAAQAVAAPGAMPSAPNDVGGAGAVPAMDSAPPAMETETPEDAGGKGDPKDTALKLAEKVRDMSSDLLEAVRTLTGEQSQMGEMEEGLEALPKAAAATLKPLYKMRKELHASLLSGTKKSLAELRDHAEELELISSVVDGNTNMNADYVATIAEDAFEDAKKAVADAHGIMKAFSKYARGTAGLMKRAEEAATDENDSDDTNLHMDFEDENEHPMHDEETEHMHEDGEMPEHEHEMHHEEPDFELPELEMHNDEMHEHMDADDVLDADVDVVMDDSVLDNLKDMGKKVKVMANFDLTTKEGRSAYRAKLAADATGKEDDGELTDESKLKTSDELEKAHRLADGQTQLDVKPSDDLGYVENIQEKHKKDMEVARAEPKVRKEAERLNQLISEGKVGASELDSLVAQGLDAEVVKYWRQFYGEAGKEGSEFGKLLTTETLKAKAAEEMSNYKVKIARAFEFATEMVRRGLLEDDRTAITAQVDAIMKWNDEGFDSMKRVVAKHPLLSMTKTASVPQVGIIGNDDNFSRPMELDFQSQLDSAFSGRKY